MGTRSRIEWCDRTYNPITGCTHSGSPGCDHCWAASMVNRFPQLHGTKPFPYGDGLVEAIPFSTVQFHPSRLDEPLRWRKPQRVFVCSMGDLFHEDVNPALIIRVFEVMVLCQDHTFLLLTKRPERMKKLVCGCLENAMGEPIDAITNIFLGVSVENQQTADQRIPILLQTPAAVRFVSVEPCLGPVDIFQNISKYHPDTVINAEVYAEAMGNRQFDEAAGIRRNWHRGGINWVVVGCESGPRRRSCNIEWIKSLRDQCVAAGVPIFVKQAEIDGKLVKMPKIDGRVWGQIPEGR
mgnify:CR=1 FL=1